MLRHLRVPIVVCLALLLASQVVAQRTAPRRSLLASALVYLGDKGLRDELKLSEEQGKKLTELRDKWLPEVIRGGPALPAREETLKQVEKAYEGVLKPEQIKRLKQVVLQELEQQFGVSRIAEYPDVVEALKLTDEQKAKLGPNTKVADALTADQKGKWKELTGKPYEARLQRSLGGFGGFGGGGFGGFSLPPIEINALQTKEVQEELKLTEDQVKEVASIEAERAKAARDLRPGSREEVSKKIAELQEAVREKLNKLLKPEQAKRLGQIVLQQDKQDLGEVGFFRSGKVNEGVKLTPAQVEKMTRLITNGRAALRKIVLSGEPAAKIEKQIETARKETRDGVEGVLTEEQRKKLKELLGEPFKLPEGGLRFPRGGFGGFPGSISGVGSLPLLLTAAALLTDAAVQKELKLTEEQVKKVPELTAQRFGEPAPDLEKELKAEQVARLKELRIQQLDRVAGPAYTLRFREVAEALKLSEAQQEKVRPLIEESYREYIQRRRGFGDEQPTFPDELRKKMEQALGEVLTADQQQKLAALRGEAYKGKLPERTARGGRGVPSSEKLTYLAAPDVQKELNLTRDQVAKVEVLRPKWEEMVKDYAQLTPEERSKKILEANEMVEKALAEALESAQGKRLKQIALQQRPLFQLGFGGGRFGTAVPGTSVLLQPDVAGELKIGADQQEKIKNFVEDAGKVGTLIIRENWGEQREDDPFEEFQEATQKLLLGLLTKDQQEKWKELLGEPFKGQVQRGFPGGGFGGPFVP